MATRKETTARKAKANTAKKTTGEKVPLLPPALVTFLKNFAWRLLGVFSIMLAAVVLLSLLSYDPTDPGVNNQTYADTKNWLGPIGANIADVLMQTLALVSYLFIGPLLVWGVKVARLKWLPLFWLNISMLPISLVLLAIAASVEAPTADFVVQAGYGGAYRQVSTFHKDKHTDKNQSVN